MRASRIYKQSHCATLLFCLCSVCNGPLGSNIQTRDSCRNGMDGPGSGDIAAGTATIRIPMGQVSAGVCCISVLYCAVWYCTALC